MVNLFQQIQNSPEAQRMREARRSRQAARRAQFTQLSQALENTNDSPVPAFNRSTRRHAFDMRKKEGDERNLIAGLHPGDSALQLAHEALSAMNIPGQVRLRYGSMDRKAGRGGHTITDGTIFIEGEIKPITGMKAYFTVPIIVKASKLLYPSVIVTSAGVPRVIAQSTFDELCSYVEVDQTVLTNRHPFDSPMPNHSNTRRSERMNASPLRQAQISPARMRGYDEEWKGGRSLESILQEVDSLLKMRGPNPDLLEIKFALKKAIQNQKVQAPKAASRTDEIRRAMRQR